MRASGPITEQMAKVNSGMLTEIFMKATGRTIRQMDMDYTNMLTGQSTSVNGKMICNMDEDKRLGPMAPSMKVSIMKVKSMERVHINGLMDPRTQEVG